MATKDTDTTKAAAPAKATPAKDDAAATKDTAAKAPDAKTQTDPPAPKAEPAEESPRVSTCVVNRGRGMHVGDAVNGTKVCSYHTMHYDRNGNRR